MRIATLALGLMVLLVPAHAEAKKHSDRSTLMSDQASGVAAKFDRHAVDGQFVEIVWFKPVTRTAGLKQIIRKQQRKARERGHAVTGGATVTQLLPHPVGCPARAFCGCGASIEVFGKNIRELWLAAAWFKFPAASPAPGMVAVRRHHVFVIRELRGSGIVLAYDANSGGRRTRLHLRSLAGYRVVNPHGGRSRYATAI